MCEQTCDSFRILLDCSGAIAVRVSAVGAAKIEPCGECMEFNSEMSKIMIEALAQNVSFARKDDVLSEVYFEIRPDSEA
jgi:hypothetical protein